LTSGTISCPISNLTYSTTYTWIVTVSDGNQWTNCSFWFITENLDSTPPVISSICYRTSDPIDLQPEFGWENISCNVTDNASVNTVIIQIKYPDNISLNITMDRKINTDTYYHNTTLLTCGNFSFLIIAYDTNDNTASCNITLIILPPNWDINSDRVCSMEDLLLASMQYGTQGSTGWIREDIDNNGMIDVFDFVILSNHFSNLW
jgi:hypothetical protein